METTALNHALMLKVNIDNLPYDEKCDWDSIVDHVIMPFVRYLKHETTRKTKKAVKIFQYSAGIHTNGKSGKPHLHLNFHVDHLPNNILDNYKYFYSKHYDNDTHFKQNKHSIRTAPMTDLKGCLAYPFKECVDESTLWKSYHNCVLHPYTRHELVTYGAGVYLAACRARVKLEDKEEKKLEKWGVFCQYMDALRQTPTVHEMSDLRGVCLVALDYFKKQPERTSVNAVITMCKDYCFKRGIWTTQQILDKYQIV